MFKTLFKNVFLSSMLLLCGILQLHGQQAVTAKNGASTLLNPPDFFTANNIASLINNETFSGLINFTNNVTFSGNVTLPTTATLGGGFLRYNVSDGGIILGNALTGNNVEVISPLSTSLEFTYDSGTQSFNLIGLGSLTISANNATLTLSGTGGTIGFAGGVITAASLTTSFNNLLLSGTTSFGTNGFINTNVSSGQPLIFGIPNGILFNGAAQIAFDSAGDVQLNGGNLTMNNTASTFTTLGSISANTITTSSLNSGTTSVGALTTTGNVDLHGSTTILLPSSIQFHTAFGDGLLAYFNNSFGTSEFSFGPAGVGTSVTIGTTTTIANSFFISGNGGIASFNELGTNTLSGNGTLAFIGSNHTVTLSGAGTLTFGGGLIMTNSLTNSIAVTNLNAGSGASVFTFWRGDGTWAIPGGGNTTTITNSDGTLIILGSGATTTTVSLNLSSTNVWGSAQQFNGGLSATSISNVTTSPLIISAGTLQIFGNVTFSTLTSSSIVNLPQSINLVQSATQSGFISYDSTTTGINLNGVLINNQSSILGLSVNSGPSLSISGNVTLTGSGALNFNGDTLTLSSGNITLTGSGAINFATFTGTLAGNSIFAGLSLNQTFSGNNIHTGTNTFGSVTITSANPLLLNGGLNPQNVTGTNVGGTAETISSGLGTGTGAVALLFLQTAQPASPGAGPQTYTYSLRMDNKTATFSNNVYIPNTLTVGGIVALNFTGTFSGTTNTLTLAGGNVTLTGSGALNLATFTDTFSASGVIPVEGASVTFSSLTLSGTLSATTISSLSTVTGTLGSPLLSFADVGSTTPSVLISGIDSTDVSIGATGTLTTLLINSGDSSNQIFLGAGLFSSTLISGGTGGLALLSAVGINMTPNNGANVSMNGGRIAFKNNNLQSLSPGGTAGLDAQFLAITVSDSTTTTNGNTALQVFTSFGIPVLRAINTGVTTTTAATVYIQGAVSASTNQTITNDYALDVAAGLTNLGGGLTAATTTISGPTSGNSNSASFTVIDTNTNSSGSILNLVAPTFSVGQQMSIEYGVAASANNALYSVFHYNANTGATNSFTMNWFGGSNFFTSTAGGGIALIGPVNVTLGLLTDSLSTSSTATFGGAITASSTLSISGLFTATNSGIVTNTMSTTGATTFASLITGASISLSGGETVSGNLTLTTVSASGAMSMSSLISNGNIQTNGHYITNGGANYGAGTSAQYGRIFGNGATAYNVGLTFATSDTNGITLFEDQINDVEILNGIGGTSFNDSTSATSSAVTLRYLFGVGISQTTLSATNTGVTYSNSALVHLGPSPLAGTNVTLTNPGWSLWTDGGINDAGALTVTGASTLVGTTTIGSASADYFELTGSATDASLLGVGSSSTFNLIIKPKGNGRLILGTNTWAKTAAASAAASLTLDNGGSDSPNVTFYYANNKNYSIDVLGSVLRFIADADESTGAVIGTWGSTALTVTGSLNVSSTSSFGALVTLANINPTLTSSGVEFMGGVVTGLFSATNSASFSSTATFAGAVSMSSTLSVGSGITSTTLSLSSAATVNHLIGGGSTPTVAAGAGSGGGTASISGSDTAMTLTVATSIGPSTNATVATITFASPYSSAPHSIVLYPANANSALLSGTSMLNATATTNSATITSGSVGLSNVTTYIFSVIVIQ